MEKSIVTIEGADSLFRQLAESKSPVINEGTGERRVSTFDVQPGTGPDGERTTNVSVSIEKLEALEVTKTNRWKDSAIGSISAGVCVELGFTVTHVPEEGFFSHGHIGGVQTKGNKKALARAMSLV